MSKPRTLKFETGDWVIVTERNPGQPDRELKGKIVTADRDHAVAECWTRTGTRRFTFSDDTDCLGITVGVTFRRATSADFPRRRRAA
jgi:hypothetical protein